MMDSNVAYLVQKAVYCVKCQRGLCLKKSPKTLTLAYSLGGMKGYGDYQYVFISNFQPSYPNGSYMYYDVFVAL